MGGVLFSTHSSLALAWIWDSVAVGTPVYTRKHSWRSHDDAGVDRQTKCENADRLAK
jgi:hypothetical protein